MRHLFGYIGILVALCSGALTGNAQTLHQDIQATWRGEVLQVITEEEREIPGTDAVHTYQEIEVGILDGPRAGEIIIIENDFLELDQGDRFYFNYIKYIDGSEVYGVVNIDRSRTLIALAVLFVVTVIAFGGMQGIRSLIALGGSFAAIYYILFPGLLAGWSPLVAGCIIAAGILFAAIFFTHGFTKGAWIAYCGTLLAVVITSIIAIIAVHSANLTGFSDEASTYLNFATGGALDFRALLLGAIIIGFLGVLDDIAVTQVAVVTELFDANPNESKRAIFIRAMRVGREHVSALINTLVLAYTGASLPLLLYLYQAPGSTSASFNIEIIATEVVRIIVGSMGLILTVPIVTFLAVTFLKGYHMKHTHSHAH